MAEERKQNQGGGNGQIVSTGPGDSRVVQLRDGGLQPGQLIDVALSNLTQSQAQALMGKAADAALQLEVKAREQNLDYVAGKKALEDHIEAFDMLDKRGHLTRQNVTSDIKTGAGNMRVESKSGATCFVATAAYGGADHPDVRFLRAFRDGWLQHRKFGRAFIEWYWRVGPKLARVVASREQLRRASRAALRLLVRGLRLCWRDPASRG
ncbi:CFI-box-CTERM domain-containing protein [Cupriavidus sp. 8B]